MQARYSVAVRGSTRGNRRFWALGLCVLGLSLPPARPAQAQDDWSITRENKPAGRRPPRKPREAASRPDAPAPRPAERRAEPQPSELIERTYRAFVAAPEDGFALRRLRELWLLRDGNLDGLVARLRDEQLAAVDRVEPALALSYVLVVLDKRDEALGVLSPFLKDTRALFLHARLLREAGRRKDAEQAYLTAAHSKASAADRQAALKALAELAMDAGDLELARTRYAELAQARGEGGAPAADFARALSARGSHAQAAQAFLKAAEGRRGDVRAMVPLLTDAARAQLAAGEGAAARTTIDRALDMARASGAGRGELYDLLIEATRQTDGLRELAERLSRDSGGGLDASTRAAKLWDELGDEARAVEAYRTLLRRSPRDLDARRALSQLLLRAGRLEEVIVEQRELVRLAPDEPAFVVGLAELLKQVGRADEAERIVREVSERAPQSLPLHRALSELYARWGDTARAEAELSLLAKLDPEDPVHLIALGSERFERGDKAGALAIWKRLLEQKGNDSAEGHAALAAVLADHDWLDLAIEHAQKAASLAPASLEHLRALASLFERAGRFPEAEASWHSTLKLPSADAATRREARQHLVGLWARFGTLRRHQLELDERLARNPRDLEAARLLAEAHAHESGPQAMRAEQAVLEKIVTQAPSDLETLRALERSYMRAGDKASALRTLERLISADPVHAADALRRAVELSLASYQDADALRFAQRAVEVRPDDARAQRLLGDLHRGLRDLDAAQAAYTRALALSPRDFDTALVLAQVEIARAKPEHAEKALLSVLQGSPDDELLSRAARALVQLDVSRAHLERVEPALLSLALAHPERPLHRKLLIELYGSWLSPLAQRVAEERATAEDRELLARVGRRALKPLLEALLDADPIQRGVALDLLGPMANQNASGSLLSLAEQSTDTAERARALIAVGMLADARMGTRLRTLTARAEGRLRPVAVWALTRTLGEDARKDLLALAADGDAGVRVIASLGLGAIGAREAAPVLRRLLQERHASVRAAALWALARMTPESALLREALSWPAPAWQVAIAASDDAPVLVRALLSADAEQRAFAAHRLQHVRAAYAERLPPPAWPFVPKAYVLRIVDRAEPARDQDGLSRALGSVFHDAVREALADPARRGVALSALTLVPGRLSVGALEDVLACPERTALAETLPPLRASLADIVRTGTDAERTLALVALARAGSAEPAPLLAVLEGPRTQAQTALLDALAGVAQVPSSLTPALMRLATSAEDWPTRMRARRALGTASASSALASESVALVRAASAPAKAISTTCPSGPKATLN